MAAVKKTLHPKVQRWHSWSFVGHSTAAAIEKKNMAIEGKFEYGCGKTYKFHSKPTNLNAQIAILPMAIWKNIGHRRALTMGSLCGEKP